MDRFKESNSPNFRIQITKCYDSARYDSLKQLWISIPSISSALVVQIKYLNTSGLDVFDCCIIVFQNTGFNSHVCSVVNSFTFLIGLTNEADCSINLGGKSFPIRIFILSATIFTKTVSFSQSTIFVYRALYISVCIKRWFLYSGSSPVLLKLWRVIPVLGCEVTAARHL